MTDLRGLTLIEGWQFLEEVKKYDDSFNVILYHFFQKYINRISNSYYDMC